MRKTKLRILTLISNILICVMSLASIGSYFLLPLWKVNASYTIPEKTIEKLLQDVLEESAAENEELKNIDISDLVDEEGLTISLSLSLKTQDIFASFGNKGPEMAQKIIDDNINSAVDSFSGTLNKLAKGLTKTVTKNALHYVIEEKLSELLPEDEMVEEIETILADVGVDPTYITSKTDELVDIIFSENATVDSVTQDVMNVVEEVCDKLAESDNEYLKDIQLTEENKQFITSTMQEALAYIADEEGNINIDDMIADVLVSILDGSFNPEELPLPEEASAQSIKRLSASSEVQSSESLEDSASDSSTDAPSQEEQDKQEELKALLRDKFMELLPKDITQKMADAMQLVGLVLIFTFLTWIYIILKIIVKLGCRNNAIHLKVPIIFGWHPFSVLYATPTLFFLTIKKLPDILGKFSNPESVQSLKQLTDGFDISFITGAWVSFAIAVFLFIFNLFFYRRWRKQLKTIAEAEKLERKEKAEMEKAEKKAAKKAAKVAEKQAKAAEKQAAKEAAATKEIPANEVPAKETAPVSETEPADDTPTTEEIADECVEETIDTVEEVVETVETVEETAEVVEETTEEVADEAMETTEEAAEVMEEDPSADAE